MENLLSKALGLAVEAHHGQLQKNGDPYILHPLHVMMQMETTTEKIIAILHDVIEDTPVSLRDLEDEGFPPLVVETVALLTRLPETPYEDYIERIRPNRLARRIKLADLQHNMDIRRMPSVDAHAAERLARYHKAWRYLLSAEDE
jgi:(p)ppGpp synthase/HD superfamily hydrolase